MTQIVSPVGMILLAGSAAVATGLRWRVLIEAMRGGTRPDPRFDHIGERIKAFVVYVIGQGRLLRWPYAGVLHAMIFWGFLILLIAIGQAIVEALWQGFQFNLLPGSSAIAFLQDLFFLVVTCGITMALYNRLVINPIRFRGSHRGDAILILVWIGLLLICMELNYATRIAEHAPEALGQWRPIASALSRIFGPLGSGSESLVVLHGIFFWAHLSLVFGFLVYLGHSKHLHIVTAALNVFFKWTEPKGRLPILDIEAVMNAEDEADQHFGPVTLEHFSWKDMLDLYTCTECGRCQTHCPAYNTGKVLSPKTLITDLRDHLYENIAGGYATTTHDAHIEHGADAAGRPASDGAVMWVTGDHHSGARHDLPGRFQPSWIGPDAVAEAAQSNGGERPLFGGTIADDTLWACTTCGACMDQCPVLIEHVPKIIEMRRHLVLDESRMPKQAETALRGIENVFNPYGLSHQARADWARDLGVAFAADKPDAEYLYWVGCASSFDDRARTIAAALVKILQAGEVDFAILGTEEKCSGDPARRIGNEYLFQERARANVEVLRKYNVRKIITSCPHDFNTFANEYSAFGGDYEVVHHTQMIERLLKDGRITLDESKRQDETITYHDSCYLGRWNDIFAPPRDILERIPGMKVVEMARNRSEGMCCGAGGGHMWMEEAQPRVNHARVEQAAATAATKVATACPFCLSMFDEGIASKRMGDRLAVDDIAVYVARSLAGGAGEDATAAVDTAQRTAQPHRETGGTRRRSPGPGRGEPV